MSIVIIAVLLIALVVVIWYFNVKIKGINEEKKRFISEENKALLNEKEELEKRIESEKKKEEQLQNVLKEKKEELSNAQKTVQKLVNDGKKFAEEQLEREMKLLKEAKMKELDKQHKEVLSKMLSEEEELNLLIEPLRKELADYTAKRASLIEAQKREQELANRVDFHRVCLSREAIEDINYIQSILNKLHKKDVVAKVIWESYVQVPAREMVKRVYGTIKTSGIYRITDIETKQCYIGQSVDVGNRVLAHIKGALGILTIADQRIHHAMMEKGIQNWIFELLEKCEKSQLNEREKFYIGYYQSNEFGFNKTVGGSGK